ncbi:DNA cytosine methyltransferase [Solimonas sp. SE-A11]|uniref:DNA cytosine methyltransferase n=1 Tax=Solimonas sp. SE-A11 TaxID=3054954 RepID=UPI00259C8EE9|nr:DNA cytosine methyltransferase [Solimonas sp. SE-A11]MDM4768652.1 DNA cytosine methyltransferase [Solimonas sp. SE-A11]
MKVIDMFSGAGGLTTGAIQAGAKVVWAANHNQDAVYYYKANHPGVPCVKQDLHQADWSQIPSHDALLAAPACTGHTPARGKDRPHHDKDRSTAWAVVSCAEYHRQEIVVGENVPAFLAWELYPAWEYSMQKLGYCVEPHIVDCADLGIPQHRVRLILVCTRSKAPLKLKLPQRPHQPISGFIQWDKHRWNPINKPGRSTKTLARVQSGRSRFGDRFVMPYYTRGSGTTGRSLDRPLGTVTTHDRWALVNGDRMRMIQVPEYVAAMDFPTNYVLPAARDRAIKLLGNAVPPTLARDVITAIKEAA